MEAEQAGVEAPERGAVGDDALRAVLDQMQAAERELQAAEEMRRARAEEVARVAEEVERTLGTSIETLTAEREDLRERLRAVEERIRELEAMRSRQRIERLSVAGAAGGPEPAPAEGETTVRAYVGDETTAGHEAAAGHDDAWTAQPDGEQAPELPGEQPAAEVTDPQGGAYEDGWYEVLKQQGDA